VERLAFGEGKEKMIAGGNEKASIQSRESTAKGGRAPDQIADVRWAGHRG